jgi:hypothetical protein
MAFYVARYKEIMVSEYIQMYCENVISMGDDDPLKLSAGDPTISSPLRLAMRYTGFVAA